MFLPVLMAKPLVGLRGLGDRRCFGAEQLQHRRLPQRGILPPQVELRLREPVGVGQHFRGQLKEGLGDAELVGDQRLSTAGLSGNELAEQLRALVSGGGKTFGERYGIVLRLRWSFSFHYGHRVSLRMIILVAAALMALRTAIRRPCAGGAGALDATDN